MKKYIIWGYLGSGKTTLINHLLQTIFTDKKVVIVENEFGETGIDSQFFKSKNYMVKELNAGCICCSLRTELPLMVKEIESLTPDVVLIEPSGVSSLDDLIQLQNNQFDQVIILVDATRLDLLLKLNRPFYEKQFRLSSVIIVTKTDQITRDKVKEITSILTNINPKADIYIDYKNLNNDELNNLFASKATLFTPSRNDSSNNISHDSITVSIPIVKDKRQIEDLISQTTNTAFGKILRIKGYVQIKANKTLKVDYVSGELCIQEIPETISSENLKLCFIGFDLKKDNISDFIIQETSIKKDVNYSDLSISTDEIYAFLGSNTTTAPPYFQTVINQQLDEIKELNGLSFGYRIVDGSLIDKSNIRLSKTEFNPGRIITNALNGSNFFLLLVATIGEHVDLWLKEKHNNGDVVDIFIADAIGSALVESIVSYALNYFETEMKEMAYSITNSYSPGYCGWRVSEQHKLFSLLPNHFCGVTLTDSSLMLPIKSVSAVIGIGEKVERKAYGCTLCNKSDCYKRNLQS